MADRFSHSCRRDNINSDTSSSSFSSTLLEEIYRSIDKVGDDIGDSMRKKRDDAATRFLFKTDEEIANYQRACMIERWMEKKAVARGRSTSDLQHEKMSAKDRQSSSSSSSDSSSGGRGAGSFSSFEVESLPVHPPKPVRTGKLGLEKEKEKAIKVENSGINRCNWQRFNDGSEQKSKPKSESKFVKTKSKALKLYDDLKKVKQPISPGGKVAAFLNSLFTAGNVKKSKISAAACVEDSPSLKSTAITCASASPFSRSCLSRTTASSAAMRSVRFFPANVILDEECRRKSLRRSNHGDADVDLILTAIDEELAMHAKKKDEFEHSFDILSKIRDRNRGFDGEFDEEDDEFDGASCASSDLFELENLSAIGMEELPVYETTHLQKMLQMD